MELLSLIIIVSLFIIGLNVASEEGYLLHPLKKRIEKYFTNENTGEISKLYQPVFGCHVCMSSFWSVFIYILLHGLSLGMLFELFVVIPSVAAIVSLVLGYEK